MIEGCVLAEYWQECDRENSDMVPDTAKGVMHSSLGEVRKSWH